MLRQQGNERASEREQPAKEAIFSALPRSKRASEQAGITSIHTPSLTQHSAAARTRATLNLDGRVELLRHRSPRRANHRASRAAWFKYDREGTWPPTSFLSSLLRSSLATHPLSSLIPTLTFPLSQHGQHLLHRCRLRR